MYTIGIDLGGTNIAVGICNEDLKIIDKASVPTLSKRPIEQIVADMAALCKKLAERNSISMDKIDRIGIAVPGTINSARGIVEYSNNIVMKNTPIVELFKKHIDKEVLITNDANAAALGEALAGSGKGKKSLVMVTLGTGVGGGIIIDGRIFEGGVNTAGGEIGHTVIVSGGRQCTCGRRGCWETYSSASALSAITAEKMRELELKGIPSLLFDEKEKEGRISARTAFSAMKRGDAYAREIVDGYISYLADGITNLINIFQPEVIAIGGGVCNEGDALLKPLKALVDRDQYTRDSASKTELVVAKLGNDAGIIGAAALGI